MPGSIVEVKVLLKLSHIGWGGGGGVAEYLNVHYQRPVFVGCLKVANNLWWKIK